MPVIRGLFAGGWFPGCGEETMRLLSNTLFGLALGCALVMKSFAIQNGLVGLAVFSVLLSALMTNFMWIRSTGIAGISGLFLVYIKLSGSYPGTILTIMIAVLISSAIVLAIYADLSDLRQGEKRKDEVSRT
jgi:hypothetical protein